MFLTLSVTMKSLFVKSVVIFVVLTTSRCAPGRLGTIDLYSPGFSVTDVDDEVYTIAPAESDDTTEDYTWAYDKDDVTEATTNETPLESLMTHIDLLAGQDGIAKGQYVYTDKTGRSITVVYVAGPSSLFKAYTSGE